MLLASRLPEQREQRSRHHSYNGLTAHQDRIAGTPGNFISRYSTKIGIPLEIALLTERTLLTFQVICFADRRGGTFRAVCDWRSGIDHKLLATRQTQVRRVIADTAIAFRVRMVGVLFTSVLIKVVRIAVIPRFNGFPAAITHESKSLSHFSYLARSRRGRQFV
jgi:hypothetical protein